MTSWQERQDRTTLRLAPLRGVRYASSAGELEALTFTPPTSWASEPTDRLSTLDPRHILHLLAPAFGADPVAGAHEARATLMRWLADGVMQRDPNPALYVYEQPGNGHGLVRGVIGTVDLSVPAFTDHEQIIERLADTQETLERTLRAQVEPILALHRAAPSLRVSLDAVTDAEPDATIGDSDGTHRLWRVTDPETIDRIATAVPDEPALIADGHHRHAAWQRTADHALTLLTDVDQPGLRLGAIHRVVSHVEPERVINSSVISAEPLNGREAASQYLRDGPEARCVIYARGTFYATTPTEPSAPCAAPELAVCHLHSHWLNRWSAAESDVDYVHDADEAISLAGEDRVAVLLPVPALADVAAAAHEGRPLPRKATSFRPKPLVGTVLRVWGS